MLLQELQVLLFKSEFIVMLHLVADVIANCSFLRWTHGEGTKSILPSKAQTRSVVLIDVLTRVRLEFSNEVCYRDLGWNAHQQVHVIVEAADFQRKAVQIFANTRHVSEDIVSNRIVQKTFTTFGAKDNVIEQLLVRRHAWPPNRCVAPAGLWVDRDIFSGV